MATIRNLRIGMDVETTALERSLKRSGDLVNGFVNRVESAGGALAKFGGPVALAGVAGVAFGIKESIEAASNLAETLSMSEQTFGSSFKIVSGFADEMADSFGASKRELLDMSAGYGNILMGAGMAGDEAAAMSVRLTKLAADAASFKNSSNELAGEKIRAGLVGEAEPLRTWGVLLSETAMKSKAAELGLVGVGEELTEVDKMMARVAIVEGGLSKAIGDLARTSGSASNQMKKLWGSMDNLSAQVGAGFLPVFTAGITIATESLSGFGKGGVNATEQVALGMEQVGVATANTIGILRGVRGAWEGLEGGFAAVEHVAVNAVEKVGGFFNELGGGKRDDPNGFLAIMAENLKIRADEDFKAAGADFAPGAAQLKITTFFDDLRKKSAETAKAIEGSSHAVAGLGTGLAKVAGMEAMEKMAADAEKLDEQLNASAMRVIDDVMSPVQKLAKEMAELTKLRDVGKINQDVFDLASTKAKADILGDPTEPDRKFAGALELGSQEARSIVMNFRAEDQGKDGIGAVAKASRESLEYQKRIAKAIEKMEARNDRDEGLPAYQFVA